MLQKIHLPFSVDRPENIFFTRAMERHPKREVTTFGLRVRFRVGNETAVPELAIGASPPSLMS
jgi:hypothetical protein